MKASLPSPHSRPALRKIARVLMVALLALGIFAPRFAAHHDHAHACEKETAAVHAALGDGPEVPSDGKGGEQPQGKTVGKVQTAGTGYDRTGCLLGRYGWVFALLASAGCAAGAYSMAHPPQRGHGQPR